MSNFSGGSSGSIFANLGVYQQIPVRLSELSFRTLVPDNISADSYHKALIAKLFFHHILSITDFPPVSFNDLLATVAAYFDINTESAEKDAEAAAQSISRSFFVFQISSVLPFLIHPESLLRFRIPITAPRTSHSSIFVLTLPLTLLIRALLKNC